MTRTRWPIATLAAFLATVLVGAETGCRKPGNGPADPATGSSAGAGATTEGATGSAAPGSAGAAGGMKAYVDPETGELLEEPPPGAEPLPGDVITPPAGARPRPAPGGGELLDTAPTRQPEPDGDH